MWLRLNPLYNGVSQLLNRLIREKNIFIVSTKKEFIIEILINNRINFDSNKIFYANGISKVTIVKEIIDDYNVNPIDFVFVDDYVNTLLEVKKIGCKCLLANWGYNTEKEQKLALDKEIKILKLNDFIDSSF